MLVTGFTTRLTFNNCAEVAIYALSPYFAFIQTCIDFAYTLAEKTNLCSARDKREINFRNKNNLFSTASLNKSEERKKESKV